MTDKEKKFIIDLYRRNGICDSISIQQYLSLKDKSLPIQCPINLHCAYSIRSAKFNDILKCTPAKALQKCIEIMESNIGEFAEILL